MFTGTLYRDVHSAQGPVNNILCTGEILTGCTGVSIGYISGGGGPGVSEFVTSLA